DAEPGGGSSSGGPESRDGITHGRPFHPARRLARVRGGRLHHRRVEPADPAQDLEQGASLVLGGEAGNELIDQHDWIPPVKVAYIGCEERKEGEGRRPARRTMPWGGESPAGPEGKTSRRAGRGKRIRKETLGRRGPPIG